MITGLSVSVLGGEGESDDRIGHPPGEEIHSTLWATVYSDLATGGQQASR